MQARAKLLPISHTENKIIKILQQIERILNQADKRMEKKQNENNR